MRFDHLNWAIWAGCFFPAVCAPWPYGLIFLALQVGLVVGLLAGQYATWIRWKP